MVLAQILEFVGPNRAVQIFGVRLVGVNAENGRKLLFSILFIAAALLFGTALKRLAHFVFGRGAQNERRRFWTRQGVQLFTAVLLIVGVASIWFDDPTRLATAAGLVTAGLAFALQRVVTAVAGYFVILRGDTFTVGDRIVMGGVRGDVIALSFTQTTIMEMGQPPPTQADAPAMWVRARQYTGRIVTVTNAKIFDEPVYNYSREFPYLWEEMTIPVGFKSDRHKAEEILLRTAERHSLPIAELGEQALQEMERRYFMAREDMKPAVYYRITENWIEMTVRFVTREHGVRGIKDKMSREILDAFDAARIEIPATTLEIVGAPPLQVTTRSESS
jgi:small-conductance mechanosensitive channel